MTVRLFIFSISFVALTSVWASCQSVPDTKLSQFSLSATFGDPDIPTSVDTLVFPFPKGKSFKAIMGHFPTMVHIPGMQSTSICL